LLSWLPSWAVPSLATEPNPSQPLQACSASLCIVMLAAWTLTIAAEL